MKRWFWWFLLAPQTFLFAGFWRDAGLPPIDMSVLACLYLALCADRRTVPWLLLGLAIGRAMVDAAALPVQILVLGIPTAVLLPTRPLFSAHLWAWHAIAATICAIVVPKLAGLCGRLFDQPSATAELDPWLVLWSALGMPPLLWLVRRLPPFQAFEATS